VITPETNRPVPAAVSQLNLKMRLVGGLPEAPSTCRPGQLNAVVALSKSVVIPLRLIRPRTTVMIT
jgi:hypothetical protein